MDFFLRTAKNNNDPFQVGRPDFFWGQGTNDLQVSGGDFLLTEDIDLLNQGIAKILVTERGANIFLADYGSLLQSFIGTNFDIDYLRANIKTDVIDTLRIYQFINQGVPNLNEQIETLQSLKIEVDPNITYGIDVGFVVITREGQTTGSLISVEG